VTSVIIPAHNEERVIARLLGALVDLPETGDPPRDGDQLRILVVCNGCTDATAQIAEQFPGVEVVDSPVPSKREALRLGDSIAEDDFPRVYVDADVELGRSDVFALAAALADPAVLAAAPERVVPRVGVSRPVRWYYDVWEQLPGVRQGIFGRGAIALSRTGHHRVAQLPLLMSDDLAMSSAFTDQERLVVRSATVVVHPPRTWADLMRRRVRAATGTTQAYAGQTDLPTDSRTSIADLRDLLRRRPTLATRMPVFLAVAFLSRRQADRAVAKGDYTTWLRDESSRSGG
jgi:glycosyltransferase involved in cell wall biosynthesis